MNHLGSRTGERAMDESPKDVNTIRRLQGLRSGLEPRTPTLDKKANALFERYRPALRAYCRSYVGDAQRAEELTNDVLMVGWRRIESYDHSASFKAWLFGIARFTCLRALEKKKDLLVDDGVLDPEDPNVQTLSLVGQQQRAELLREAISQMGEVEQRALCMRYFEGMPVAQITEALELTNKAGARGVLKRSRDQLRRRLRTVMEEFRLRTSFWLT